MADEPQVYTPDDEPLMHRIAHALKSAFRGGDTNLPDESPETPQRRAAFDREKGEDAERKSLKAIETFKQFGERMNGERIRTMKNKGMTEEQATRAALRRE